MLQILVAPFAACVVLAALHCYMGLHILRRGVIFVDLALAQMAALGATVAVVLAPVMLPREHGEAAGPASAVVEAADPWLEEPSDPATEALTYGFSLLFAFAGAGLIAVGRLKDNRVPHEAFIGIVYVVSAALAMLALNKAPHGSEKMEAMLLGSILFVGWREVGRTAALYAVIAVLHVVWGRRFLSITESPVGAEAQGLKVRLWDFLFYVTFGLMVTQSVKIGGVLVVFSFLIIPAACATLLLRGFWPRLLAAWALALVASVAGLWFSAAGDMPTGASLVAAFGAMLAVCAAVAGFRGGGEPSAAP